MRTNRIILMIFLVLIDQNCSYYYMHSTDRHRHPSTYDCLSVLSTIASTIHVDYCRREDAEQVNINSGEEDPLCFNGTIVSFHDLRAQRITEFDLLDWYAPIDVIDQYQLFLDKNVTTNNWYFWCNCTSETFGARCEYTFEQYKLTKEEINNPHVASRFYFIIQQQFRDKVRTSPRQSTVTNGTCYMGLPECNRNRIICLHWNQICDGKLFVRN